LTVYIEKQEYENEALRRLYESPSVKERLQCFKRTVDISNTEIDLIICLGGDGISNFKMKISN
jgi:hypothetical protein